MLNRLRPRAAAAAHPEATVAPADAGDAGYGKDLKARHVNMIAVGGAIGTCPG